jgi:hypothetical protein
VDAALLGGDCVFGVASFFVGGPKPKSGAVELTGEGSAFTQGGLRHADRLSIS